MFEATVNFENNDWSAGIAFDIQGTCNWENGCHGTEFELYKLGWLSFTWNNTKCVELIFYQEMWKSMNLVKYFSLIINRMKKQCHVQNVFRLFSWLQYVCVFFVSLFLLTCCLRKHLPTSCQWRWENDVFQWRYYSWRLVPNSQFCDGTEFCSEMVPSRSRVHYVSSNVMSL